MASPRCNLDLLVRAPLGQQDVTCPSGLKSSFSLYRYAVKNADSLLGLQAPEPLARLVRFVQSCVIPKYS